MKKLTLTTEKVLAAFNVLSSAKYSKLDDVDKIKVWKITRKLKPVAEKFDDDSKDAAEKMKPSEDFNERLVKAQEYERTIKQPDFDASKLPMGAAEYSKFVDEFKAYQKLVNDTISDFAKKEVEVEIEILSEDAFCKLMASNDWNMAQVVALDEFVGE
jgi:hypothetical protein